HAVAEGEDGGQVVGVRGDGFVHLLDGCRPFGPAILHLGVTDHPAGPQRVVADEQAAGTDPVTGRAPRLGIAVLVDVAVDDVELAGLLVQRFHRVADVERYRFVQSGSTEVVPRLPLVLRVSVRQVQGSLRTN